jgi:hypothetical protein
MKIDKQKDIILIWPKIATRASRVHIVELYSLVTTKSVAEDYVTTAFHVWGLY